MNIYDYSVPTPDGTDLDLKQYEGKVIMIVNTATGCGFTPQYEDLEQIYHDCHDKGLEIIDIPCNQFKGQAPGTDEEIHEFCTLTYHTEFPQMRKSDVNGEHALDLYTYLKSQRPFEGFGRGAKAFAMGVMLKKIDRNYKSNPDIKWNFTKFVIDRAGNVVARFEPTADMKDVRDCVEGLL